MQEFLNTEFSAALDEVGSAMERLGRGLRRLAATAPIARQDQRDHPKLSRPTVDPSVTRTVRLLLTRLGDGNRDFLWHAAMQFNPGMEFSLAELADAADVSVGTARARLMNIGRSLKALGARGVLWDATWDDGAKQMTYEWSYDGHEAVLQEMGL